MGLFGVRRQPLSMKDNGNGRQGEKEEFVRLVDLSKAYREGDRRRVVLQDASATFVAGEFVALLGRSGSGKSTLLNLMSGIDAPDGGQVWISGHELTGMNERDRTLFRRRYIGFVFQFFNLIPTLTVLENVTLPVELNGAPPKAAKLQAEPLLDAVGLLDRAKTYPDKLSGGEQQRIAIARALVHDPQLVLADEPTGNLDENTGESVLALLDRLTRQAGKNLVMVTHSAESAGWADRVFHLHDGKVEYDPTFSSSHGAPVAKLPGEFATLGGARR